MLRGIQHQASLLKTKCKLWSSNGNLFKLPDAVAALKWALNLTVWTLAFCWFNGWVQRDKLWVWIKGYRIIGKGYLQPSRWYIWQAGRRQKKLACLLISIKCISRKRPTELVWLQFNFQKLLCRNDLSFQNVQFLDIEKMTARPLLNLLIF